MKVKELKKHLEQFNDDDTAAIWTWGTGGETVFLPHIISGPQLRIDETQRYAFIGGFDVCTANMLVGSKVVYSVKDFTPEEHVRYVPNHAHGDPKHKDVEPGIVSSMNDKFVFVKYIKRGILQETAAATDPGDLIKGWN
jgi:hypothetical protein